MVLCREQNVARELLFDGVFTIGSHWPLKKGWQPQAACGLQNAYDLSRAMIQSWCFRRFPLQFLCIMNAKYVLSHLTQKCRQLNFHCYVYSSNWSIRFTNCGLQGRDPAACWYRIFGGIFCCHLQVWSVRFNPGLGPSNLNMSEGGIFLPKRPYSLTSIHAVTFQKTQYTSS